MTVKTIPDHQFFLARFNCYHAGAGYDEFNIRLHFYIEPIGIVRNKTTGAEEPRIVKGWRDKRDVYFADADITNTNLNAYLETRSNNFKKINKRKWEA